MAHRTVRFVRALPAGWRDVPAVALGAVRASGGPPDLHALVARGSAPERRLELFADGSEQLYVYQQALLVGALLAVGFGHEVHLVPLDGGEARTLRLRSYFASLHRSADALYVASGEDVTRLTLDGDVEWVSPQIAVDGVRVETITDETVSGEAEHDPPGGWRPFRLRARDGRPE